MEQDVGPQGEVNFEFKRSFAIYAGTTLRGHLFRLLAQVTLKAVQVALFDKGRLFLVLRIGPGRRRARSLRHGRTPGPLAGAEGSKPLVSRSASRGPAPAPARSGGDG